MKLKTLKFHKRQLKRISKYEKKKKTIHELMTKFGGYNSFAWWKRKYEMNYAKTKRLEAING